MAKYTVLMSCGHEDVVELFGKDADRKRKIEYFQDSGLCKECYKKKMQAQARQDGLIFNASVLPYIDELEGNILVSVWFSGDTMPYKDEIKALGGYRWSERDSADDMLSLKTPPKCWNKQINLDDLQDEANKAESIGAKKFNADDGFWSSVNLSMALDKQKAWKAKQEEISKLEKPICPEILQGHRWNQTIYGKAGNHTVYLDGRKVSLTDDEAEAINNYLEKSSEYDKKVDEIKNAKKP